MNGVGPSLMAPVAPQAPEETPEEFLARLQKWQLPGQLDPRTLAMLNVGTALMQPVAFGQSPVGHAGLAVQGGVNTFQQAHDRQVGQSLAMERALAERTRSQGEQRAREETIMGSRSTRGINQAKAPSEIRKVDREVQSADAVDDLRYAQREESLARAAAARTISNTPRRQTVSSQVVENEDGTRTKVSLVVIDGDQYTVRQNLPRFTDPAAARKVAEKDIEEQTPGIVRGLFGAKAGYTGTKEQAIEERTRQLLDSTTTIEGPDGRPVTPDEFMQRGQTSSAVPGELPGAGSSMPPANLHETAQERSGALERRLEILNQRLTEAKTRGLSTGPLEREIARTQKQLQQAPRNRPTAVTPSAPVAAPAAATTPAAPQAQRWVRDAAGNFRPAGTPATATTGNATPGAPLDVEAALAKVQAAQAAFQAADKAMLSFDPKQVSTNSDLWRYTVAESARRKRELAQAVEELRRAQRQRAEQSVYEPMP